MSSHRVPCYYNLQWSHHIYINYQSNWKHNHTLTREVENISSI